MTNIKIKGYEDYKIVRGDTEAGKCLRSRCNVNLGACLRDVYGCYSKAKEYAFQDCLTLYADDKEDPRNFRIVSHNSYRFCVAWENNLGTIYITPAHNYLILKERV